MPLGPMPFDISACYLEDFSDAELLNGLWARLDSSLKCRSFNMLNCRAIVGLPKCGISLGSLKLVRDSGMRDSKSTLGLVTCWCP